MAATTSAATWKHFPRYMIAAMLVVIVVNMRFIYIAVSTFPGVATNDDFDTSNRYDKILNAVAEQDKLGWAEIVGGDGLAPVVTLTGPDHKALAGATVTANAERPLGSDALIALTFKETAPGHYASAATLPLVGQWDLKLTIAQGGHTVRVTRRVVLR